MFGSIKKYFFTAMTFINANLSNVNSLECVSMKNQECKIRTEIINLNTNEPMAYPYSIKIHRSKGSCNTINDPYAKICVPDQIKDTNVKVFNLMSRTNETRRIKWHNTCKCKCRLDASICNNKQEVFDGIKEIIKKINDYSQPIKYDDSYMKFKFSTYDNIPLNKTILFPPITIIIRSVTQKDGKYYPQLFRDECLYEV